MTTGFDPVQYKATTRQQWEEAAGAWHAWAPTLESWLGHATELMLDMAGITEANRVLDVAAGAGSQTITAARRVGPTGYVLATDISPTILDYAAEEAGKAGLTNVGTCELDGEQLEVEPETFDAVISRLGLIYFPDQQQALSGMHRALRPGGRVAAIVYSTAARNEFFSIPISIIRRRANLPPPLPGQPGPFSLGSSGVVEDAFTQAGFRDVEARLVAAPLRLPSATEYVRFARESFGALHQMLAGLTGPEQEEAWKEIEGALARFERDDGFLGPCELIIAAGVR